MGLINKYNFLRWSKSTQHSHDELKAEVYNNGFSGADAIATVYEKGTFSLWQFSSGIPVGWEIYNPSNLTLGEDVGVFEEDGNVLIKNLSGTDADFGIKNTSIITLNNVYETLFEVEEISGTGQAAYMDIGSYIHGARSEAGAAYIAANVADDTEIIIKISKNGYAVIGRLRIRETQLTTYNPSSLPIYSNTCVKAEDDVVKIWNIAGPVGNFGFTLEISELEIGKTYDISFECKSISGAGQTCRAKSGTWIDAVSDAVETVTARGVCASTTLNIYITAEGSAHIDNLVIEEVKPEITEIEFDPDEDIREPLPRFFNRNTRAFRLLMVPGETTKFYINALFTFPENTQLCLVNGINTIQFAGETIYEDNVVASNIGTIQNIPFASGYNYYCEFTNPSVADGEYQLAFCVAGVKFMESNYLWVVNNNYNNISALCYFRHDRCHYGVHYDYIPDFYQQFRLQLTEDDKQDVLEIEQYTSSTSGKIRNYKPTASRFIKFRAYYLDDKAHEALSIMIESQDLYINAKKYTLKKGLGRNTDTTNETYPGEFELYEEEYSSDRFCGHGNPKLFYEFTNGNAYDGSNPASSFETSGNDVSWAGNSSNHISTNLISVSNGDTLTIEFDLVTDTGNIVIGCYKDKLISDLISETHYNFADGHVTTELTITEDCSNAAIMITPYYNSENDIEITNFTIVWS